MGDEKPGRKTSEFKITVGTILFAVAAAAGALATAPVSAPIAIGAAVIAAGISSLGYSVSRGKAKVGK